MTTTEPSECPNNFYDIDELNAEYDAGFQDGIESARGVVDMIEDVREFHEACGTNDPQEPTWPPYDKRKLRYHLLFEEQCELSAELLPELCGPPSFTAGSQDHLAALAKEIVDVIYVAIGTALSAGIPLEEVWAEVHQSNMAKVDPSIGKVRRRDDGKILKPDGWQKPDVKWVMFDDAA